MKKVVIESPLAGHFERNIRYARLCALDCLQRGEAPYASHLFFTQMLDDELKEERELGIKAGFIWADAAEVRAVYDDFGISSGMKRGIAHGKEIGQEIDYRKLPAGLMTSLESADSRATQAAIDWMGKEVRAMEDVFVELSNAQAKFAPFNSPHEGWAVLMEEVDELWEAVRMKQTNDQRLPQMKKEATQVGAMAMRFLLMLETEKGNR